MRPFALAFQTSVAGARYGRLRLSKREDAPLPGQTRSKVEYEPPQSPDRPEPLLELPSSGPDHADCGYGRGTAAGRPKLPDVFGVPPAAVSESTTRRMAISSRLSISAPPSDRSSCTLEAVTTVPPVVKRVDGALPTCLSAHTRRQHGCQSSG